jgi:hypothetical protein
VGVGEGVGEGVSEGVGPSVGDASAALVREARLGDV